MKMRNSIIWYGRISLFVIYFWFGFLKSIGVSPAEGLVNNLFHITLERFMAFDSFFFLFGLFECIIGMSWLIPKYTRFSFYTLIFHLLLTIMPLFVLLKDSWTNILTPTLVGQYIIKNLALLAMAFFILDTMDEKQAACVVN
jgi:uncharacterized membrane protein YkgB